MTRDEIERLIARTAMGDRSAFRALYEATSGKLFAVCLRVLRDNAEAEDAVQDVYVKVWQNAGRYQAGGLSPMTWLITIARNRAIDKLRARKAPADDVTERVDIADAGPTPEGAAIAVSERSRIVACLGELPRDRAAAVRGAYLDGLTYAELANRYDVPLNTMRSWLRRSLLKLKECLSQ